MPTPLVVNGITYQYPVPRDKKWGAAATAWATAVTATIAHLRAPTAPLAGTGQIRLGNLNSIAWRNAGNTGNITLFVNGSDQLIYDDGITQKDLTLVGAGNVQNNDPSTDNSIPKFVGISGGVIEPSLVLIDDSNNLSIPANLDAVDGDFSGDLNVDGMLTLATVDVLKALVPIGTVIWFYDFNGALTLDSTYWKPCDGNSYTIGGSSRLTPDLSGRYIVGFGTDGGQDINTAPWSTTVVGIAGNLIDLAHTHTMPHTHDINPPNTTSTSDGSHSHTAGTLAARIEPVLSSNTLYADTVSGLSAWTTNQEWDFNGNSASSSSRTKGVAVAGSTSTTGAHTHDVNIANFTSAEASSSTTDSALSATQSIQPRSIRMRAFIRAK